MSSPPTRRKMAPPSHQAPRAPPSLAGCESTECPDLGADFLPEGGDSRIVPVQHGHVPRLLPGEDAPLERDVFLQAGVTIEMVLAQIEQHGDAGPERVGRLQLEGGDLEDRHVDGAAHQSEGGLAEVSGGHRAQPRGSQHPLDQANGRRLAVGTGHRHDRDRERAEGELHVAPGPAGAVPVALSRNARTRHHQVEVRRVGEGLAQSQRHVGRKLSQTFELVPRPLVDGRHLGSPPCAERSRAPSRDSEAEHQHALSGEIVHQRNFNDERATRERMIATIQKRTTIFCSAQPTCSK